MGFKISNGVLVKYIMKRDVSDLTIPDGVKCIGKNAFEGCSGIKIITLPDSVTHIGEMAFYKCLSLESIIIPDSVANIEKYAFCRCSSLKSITIPDGVTHISESAFEECSELESVIIPDSVTHIGKSAFYKCSSLKSVTIPDSVANIDFMAFYDCYSLTDITIPDGIKNIDNVLFDTDIKRMTIYKGDIKISFNIDYDSLKESMQNLLSKFIGGAVESRPEYFKSLSESLYSSDSCDFMNCYYLEIALAFFMWLAYPQESAYYLDYLKQNAEKAVEYLIAEENIELLYKFLELRFITEKNIDDLISCAIEHTQNGGSPEPQLVLTQYKNDNIGTNGADAFDKYFI